MALEPNQRRGPSPIRDAIQAFLKETGLRSRPQDLAVFEAWEKASGQGRRAVPVRYRAGELVVEVDSAVHLQELRNFTGEGIRRQLNRHLQSELVKKLTFKLRS